MIARYIAKLLLSCAVFAFVGAITAFAQPVPGGGGSGGGGAVTAASGAFVDCSIVAIGCTTDTPYSGSGSGTLNAIDKAIYAAVAGPIPAGSNIIGTVDIQGNSGIRVDFSAAGTASILNVLGAGGEVVNSTPSLTTGRGAAMALTTAEGLQITPKPSSDSDVAIVPVGAFSASSLVVKSSAGNVYEIEVTQGGTAGFVVEYNGTSAPSGALSPCTAVTTTNCVLRCVPLAASAYYDVILADMPDYAGTGIVIVDSASCSTAATLETATAIFGKAQ